MSFDEAFAYDCVENPYICHILYIYGFGMTFITNIRIVYCNAQWMVKFNGTLTAPFRYARGVR
jgi:hypothetical protein